MELTANPDLITRVIEERAGSMLVLNGFELDMSAPDTLFSKISGAIDDGEHLYAVITVNKPGDPDHGNRLTYVSGIDAFVDEWCKLYASYGEGEINITFYVLSEDLHADAQKALESH